MLCKTADKRLFFLLKLAQAYTFLFTGLPLSSQKFQRNGKEIICIKLDPVFCFCSCMCGYVPVAHVCQLYYRYFSVYLLLLCKGAGFNLS